MSLKQAKYYNNFIGSMVCHSSTVIFRVVVFKVVILFTMMRQHSTLSTMPVTLLNFYYQRWGF